MWKMFFMSFSKYFRGMSQHELLHYSILSKANLRDSLQMVLICGNFPAKIKAPMSNS